MTLAKKANYLFVLTKYVFSSTGYREFYNLVCKPCCSTSKKETKVAGLKTARGDTIIIRARVESVGVWPIVIIVIMSRHTREEGTGAR